MTRAEMRRAAREESKKTKSYTLTEEQIRIIKQEATTTAVNEAMILLLTLPLEVLMDHYWQKTYDKKIPEFTNYVLEYYEKWQNGERLNYNTLPPRLQKHKNKQSFLNRFCVVDPNGCCHTVVAHIAMDGHYYIYPTEQSTIDNARSITVREAARIQSFPDDYYFEGSRTSAFMQIGNAVPVMMAYNIAEAIRQQIEEE